MKFFEFFGQIFSPFSFRERKKDENLVQKLITELKNKKIMINWFVYLKRWDETSDILKISKSQLIF